ncbi:6448_t:CDS:2, partial [Cetraspora pellucida]
MQNGITKEMAEYNVYNTILNIAKACNVDDELKLSELIDNLLINETNNHLIVFDYIYIEDKEVNEGLTKEKILKI